MATEAGKRIRARAVDLPSAIPTVPVFDGEDTIDASNEAQKFLAKFTEAVDKQDWDAFGELFSKDSFWKDSLTLTFDKRTLMGRDTIVEAWKDLSSTRKPSGFSLDKSDTMAMSPQFVRLAPVLATLDVPFGFSTDSPKSKCIGLAKLVPEDNKWKIWVLATAVVSLEEHPFATLPRKSPSLIGASQRGKAQAQGLPKVEGVLDAIVIGASNAGLCNTIMLDSIGANVVVFDKEFLPGGTWVTQRYESVTLHHSVFMVQLPQFPVPSEGYPKYLPGRDLARYYAAAVEQLKLPFFGGIKVESNTYDETSKLWQVHVKDLTTGNVAVLQAKNIVISTGLIVSEANPHFPDLRDQHKFQGPVQHTAEYRNAGPYKGKRVILVGSGNSAHDVANDLTLNGAKSVTILQRSPTTVFDFDVIEPMVAMRYQGDIPVDTADFLDSSMPTSIIRDLARGAQAMLAESQAELNAALESKGYLLDKTPDMIPRAYEERGRSFYMDQPKMLQRVLNDEIKIARGEAKGFVENGLIVFDKAEGKEKVLETDGVVLATGYTTIDLPKQYAQSGFVDAKSAATLENVSQFGLDTEGEVPGMVTFSGHPHLYFSGLSFYWNRWVGRYTAIQVMADVTGKFPSRYHRRVS